MNPRQVLSILITTSETKYAIHTAGKKTGNPITAIYSGSTPPTQEQSPPAVSHFL